MIGTAVNVLAVVLQADLVYLKNERETIMFYIHLIFVLFMFCCTHTTLITGLPAPIAADSLPLHPLLSLPLLLPFAVAFATAWWPWCW